MSALRVLLVAAATSTAGGGEKHVADLIRHLPERGFQVGLVAPGGGDLAELVARQGVPAWAAPLDRGFSRSRIATVRSAIREFRPDVVHAHGSRAALFARVADPQARERVVYTVHGIHIDKAGSVARRTALLAVERVLCRQTARFVTVADADIRKGAALGILDPARTTTVHNGIDLPPPPGTPGRFRQELGLAGDTPIVLSIGRFHEQKDHRTLVSAVAMLADAVPSARLVLVGAGELESAVREHVAASRLGDRVIFVSPRRSLADAYTDAAVVTLSSRWEGLPYVVLEAMAYGKPVVATSVDGIPEAVVHGETGLLVPPRDPAALAAALKRVLRDPDAARAMGAAGASRVAERFSIGRMIDELCALYRDLGDGEAG